MKEAILAETEVSKELTGSEQEFQPDPQEKQLSERDFKIAMKRAYAERAQKIKENKMMLEDLAMEVTYWKAQADLLKHRYEKMDYFIKNAELEPKYLALIEEQKIKNEEKVIL